MIKKILLLSLLTLLTNCASTEHNGSSWIVSTTGSSMGAVTAGGVCAGIVTDPTTIAACASVGAIKGADQIWNDDFNTHKHYFVDHLIGAPNKPNITNWYNPKTNNSGIIKTTRTWYEGPLKCRDYSSTINISPSWPMATFSSGPVRNIEYGTACILPDGRVLIK